MEISNIVGTVFSVAAVVVSVGVAWGRITKGQAELRTKLIDTQKQLEARLLEAIQELRLIPTLYVRTDVDLQRNRLMDERDASIRGILNDIKDELKHLRRGTRGPE